jgi:hypothetical protein
LLLQDFLLPLLHLPITFNLLELLLGLGSNIFYL